MGYRMYISEINQDGSIGNETMVNKLFGYGEDRALLSYNYLDSIGKIDWLLERLSSEGQYVMPKEQFTWEEWHDIWFDLSPEEFRRFISAYAEDCRAREEMEGYDGAESFAYVMEKASPFLGSRNRKMIRWF